MNLARNLKALREAKEMTQVELAEKVGVSKQAISSIEKRNNFPSFETGLKIARVLGVTCEELAYGEEMAK